MRLKKQQSGILNQLLLYSPILLCILIMLPRLVSPQFGLFDDGNSLITAQKITHGVWDMRVDYLSGRFRPVYWLFFTLFYWLFGKNPFWYFLGNTLVFGITAFCIIQLVLVISKSRLQAWASGILFVLAGPTIENYYTLSKGEPVQVGFLCISLLGITAYTLYEGRWKRMAVILATASAILLSDMTKEMSLVLLPISLVWFLASWLGLKRSQDQLGFITCRAYLTSNVISSVAFVALRTYYVTMGVTGGTYAGNYILSFSHFLASILRWAGWLIHDFSYIVPLVIILLIVYLFEKRLLQSALLFNTLVWMGAWVVAYLPWALMAEYYMLPFTVGISVFGGILIPQAVEKLTSPDRRKRMGVGIGLGFSVLLLLVTLMNNVSNPRIQLAVDAANSEMLGYVIGNIPPNSAVWVNIQGPNEYTDEIEMHLAKVKDRPDINFDIFKFQTVAIKDDSNPQNYYIIAPEIINQPLLVVRLGVQESSQKNWNGSLQGYMGDNWKTVYATEHHFRLLNIDLPRLFCPFMRFLNYCSSPVPSIDRRIFSYGWKVYNLTTP